MKNGFLAFAVVIAMGCGSEHAPATVTTTGAIDYQAVEGGVWVIRADGGTTYIPRGLPEVFKVVGTRVQVTLVERRDLASVYQFGVLADVVAIEEDSCASAMCGAPEPPVTLHVTDGASLAAVPDVTLTNLSVPAPPGGGGPTLGCTTGPTVTTCFVDARAAGTYAFDVTAPGHETTRVTVDVPAHLTILGVCCQAPWDPQTVDVALTPVG